MLSGHRIGRHVYYFSIFFLFFYVNFPVTFLLKFSRRLRISFLFFFCIFHILYKRTVSRFSRRILNTIYGIKLHVFILIFVINLSCYILIGENICFYFISQEIISFWLMVRQFNKNHRKPIFSWQHRRTSKRNIGIILNCTIGN